MKTQKKKWSNTAKRAEKREFSPILTQEQYDQLLSSIPKSKLLTPQKLALRFKVSLTVARQVLEKLVSENKLERRISSHNLHAYMPHPSVAIAGGDDKEEGQEQQQGQKKPGKKGKKQ